MSTILSGASADSKILSSCVRPGVFEVRARLPLPVKALISDDLPTLERPAKAISVRSMGGKSAIRTQPFTKTKGRAKSNRPASINASGAAGSTLPAGLVGLRRSSEARHDVAEKIDLHPVPLHDDRLLNDRKGIVPAIVDHQTRRERAERKGEDD